MEPPLPPPRCSRSRSQARDSAAQRDSWLEAGAAAAPSFPAFLPGLEQV